MVSARVAAKEKNVFLQGDKYNHLNPKKIKARISRSERRAEKRELRVAFERVDS